MKLRIYLYFLVLTGTFGSSCSKQFLNQLPSTAVNASSAINTPNDMTDAVNGMYSAAKSSSLFGGNVPILGDLLADNIYVSSSNYGQYITENNYSFISSSGEASGIWDQGYYTILQANRIIASGLDTGSVVGQLLGEAYTIRGLTYLTLVNYFATPYTVSSSALGVPIVTIPTYTTGPYLKPARNTVAEVYTRIITDLDSAYLLMPATPISSAYHATSSNYIAKYTAKAIEARAYLYEGDYADARDAALLVVQNGGYTLTSGASAFTAFWASPSPNSTKLETILELSNTATTNNSTIDDMYDQAGNGELLADSGLYNDYTATDFRKTLIINGIRKGNSEPGYIVNKFPNLLNPVNDQIKVIRYAEVLLTLAEGYAQTGDNTDALLYLNQLAQARDPSFAGYTSTGAQLVSDIVNERRKELAFEGLRFWDLTRLNQVINRPPQPYSYPSYTPVLTTDIRRLEPIPLSETDANPNMVQNPGF